MIYHMLPGDAQVGAFKNSGISGEMLVCRECLIEGDISGETLDEFFVNRSAFINAAYGDDPANYNGVVASQFRPLKDLSVRDEINLWFEYELFCAANLWFCLSLLVNTEAAVYRVEPIYRTTEDRWEGFGGATGEDMRRCFESRIRLTDEDIELGSRLWTAFRTDDPAEMERLSDEVSPAFPYLSELCEAAALRDSEPKRIADEIKREGNEDFSDIFAAFRQRAGIYGFGDSQLKRVLELA